MFIAGPLFNHIIPKPIVCVNADNNTKKKVKLTNQESDVCSQHMPNGYNLTMYAMFSIKPYNLQPEAKTNET